MRDYNLVIRVKQPTDALRDLWKRGMLPGGTRAMEPDSLIVPVDFQRHHGGKSILVNVPDWLVHEQADPMLESTEYGHKGAYAYIITGHTGEPLAPYYWKARPQYADNHGWAEFAGSRLGRVIWIKQPHGSRIVIDQASVHRKGRDIILLNNQVFSDDLDASGAAPVLPEALQIWQPAVQAVFERLKCTSYKCSSHFRVS